MLDPGWLSFVERVGWEVSAESVCGVRWCVSSEGVGCVTAVVSHEGGQRHFAVYAVGSRGRTLILRVGRFGKTAKIVHKMFSFGGVNFSHLAFWYVNTWWSTTPTTPNDAPFNGLCETCFLLCVITAPPTY